MVVPGATIHTLREFARAQANPYCKKPFEGADAVTTTAQIDALNWPT